MRKILLLIALLPGCAPHALTMDALQKSYADKAANECPAQCMKVRGYK